MSDIVKTEPADETRIAPTYEIDVRTGAAIEAAFGNHIMNLNQGARAMALRDSAESLAQIIAQQCPLSRERAVAMTKLEEVVMWAVKSIALEVAK